jgi:hypothetical protein
MARVIPTLSMILVGLAVAPELRAQQTTNSQPAQQLDHRGQTGLSLMPGFGYRVIVPYKPHKDCVDPSGDASKAVCTRSVPFFTDLQLSWGMSKRVDILTDIRFQIAKDPINQGRAVAFAPGVRFWLDEDVAAKFFTSVQVLYEYADYKGVVSSADFGIRNANGLMYDVIRNVGFFVQFGETMGFIRWFRIELDVGLGVQVRFP